MSRQQQRGITMIGWLFLLTPLAIVIYAGIRLAPIYMNYAKVARSLEQIAEEAGGGSAVSPGSLRLAIERRFDIEAINFPDVKDIGIRRVDDEWTLQAIYDDQAPLFYNLSLLVSFDKTVPVQ